MNAVPTMAEPHVPVLLDEVCASLAPLQGALVIDGTFGAGGYARAFLAAGAHVIGIDRDPNALSAADDLTGLTLVAGVFGDIEEHAAVHAPEGADAVVLDIGVSSMQLDQAERGFSFLRDGPLDMRMGSDGPSAADLIADLTEEALADILYRYGEERASRRIAKAIVSARAQRPIARTLALAEIVAGCLPAQRPGQIHPATRTFQALRIAVNDELGELVRALAGAEKVLRVGGRLAIVSFHSLEDRIVKRYLQMASATSAGGSRHGPDQRLPAPRFARPPKPITASKAEISRNPRARSARLRWAVRTDAPSRAFEPKAIGLPVLATINRGHRS